MPLVAIALLQIMCAVHAVRTGQDRYWVYLIIALPGIGCAIYVLSIMLPSLLGSRDGQKMIRHAHDKLDPERHVRLLRDELIISGTSQNHVHLADELVRIGKSQEAVEHYRAALTSIFRTDPDIMMKLALAQFNSDDFTGCQETLEAAIVANPDYQSQDGHLLYARALTENGLLNQAEDEFRVLIGYYSGPEARYRYYELLRKQNRLNEAKEQLEIISITARRSKAHYRRLHKEWLTKVNQEMKTF